MQKVTNISKILLYSLLLIFSLILCLSTVSADPDIIYVNNDTGDDNYDGQSATFDPVTGNGPKLTIKNATGTVTANGVVNIADGLYTGTGNRVIEITRSMSIIGQSQSGTIIDAEGVDWIFDVHDPGLTVLFSQLTLKNSYIDWDDGAAIWSEGSSVTVSDCSFIDNYVDNGYDGGAIYNNGGDLTVINCLFKGNYASRHGGAIYSKNGDVTVTDSIFKKNKARRDGGAIYNKKGDLTITGSIFKKNKARRDGGAIYHEQGALTVTDSLFKKNIARNVGGAIFNDGELTCNNCNYKFNSAEMGGAIANDDNGKLTCNDCDFTYNLAVIEGGAIDNWDGELTCNNCNFTENVAISGGAIGNNGNESVVTCNKCDFIENAAVSGGAIFNIYDGRLTCNKCDFVDNKAIFGGAINNWDGELTCNNCDFNKNTADVGGAIYIDGTATCDKCDFTENTADYGGAIYNLGDLSCSYCDFVSNTADIDGGAIYNAYDTVTVIGSKFINNTATSGDGGALNNYNGDFILNFNRIVGNTADNSGDAIYSAGTGSANAEYNWWGLNNPNFTNLISGPSTVDYNPWLFMTLTANPTTINNRETSQITVNFNNYSSDGTTYTPLPEPLAGHIPDLTPVNFQTDLGSVGSKTIDKFTADGIATATLKADELAGTAHLTATTDLETLNTDVVINPKSSVYLTITPGKTNPVVGDTVVYTLKVGNRGPDAAENVVMTYKIPEGLEFVGARDDIGNKWTYDPATRTLTWNLGTVPVGDPYLWLSLRIVRAGNYLLNPVLTTTTYDPTLNSDTQSLTIHAATSTQVNAQTIGMQKTGLPLLPLILASLMLVGGLMAPRRIK